MDFSAAAERSGSATPIPRWTIPDGFAMSADPEVAYRWDEDGSCLKDACWDMTVTTLYGCPHSLYVELTTLTADDIPVGYTNDKVGSIRAGEQAHMQFETSNEAADKVRIAIVTCD